MHFGCHRCDIREVRVYCNLHSITLSTIYNFYCIYNILIPSIIDNCWAWEFSTLEFANVEQILQSKLCTGSASGIHRGSTTVELIIAWIPGLEVWELWVRLCQSWTYLEMVSDTVQEEPAVSYIWASWVWEITGRSSRLPENYLTFTTGIIRLYHWPSSTKVETPYHDNDLILTPIISPQSD